MKAIATLALATMAVSSVFATAAQGSGQGSWTLNLGIAFPSGDHKDAGFDNMFGVGVDYNLGMVGNGSNATSYIGVAALFGSGDSDTDSRTWGVHYGWMFPLNNGGNSSNFALKLQGGYYNTEIKSPSAAVATEDKWALGGMVGLVWKPQSNSGQNYQIELGYYMYPKVSGADNVGFQVSVGIPFNSK
ncbi:MAG: outer membrane beta-barrel protein [Armatimonadetes bacterium]|uniref:Outer membrane protein beta-barrel domain-containing protein n=1 Tax=Candidatus Nitrosymbiomonas proteolyticus TaxID=2608984 RepID=A0A809RX73_9BACT|nr:MAG: hypothetical protein EDM74_00480 [Armatimonadota bacterium]KXK18868.1 MAG: hypothetical protein UZ18_ATM001000744 [Armatimonadetes bacterium OLB18]MCK6632482.1 hypothetical protein [Fimbriimonadaceae bacterium]QOJ12607.1 MAG: outer membrane beta-barrel protein [Chthonomonadaceae bacterium]BBO24502.1 conserved hypothetical protein [Candidatus Nitrosymbiomonas proteolyticus]